ncbi:WhiB family transcriptional regulator [Nocardia sp. NPDC056611]|uniref:WhiB family transcriptional regulator n=1 Tax=Nocardia sp. NPDC056611 TaxID=3345877 RepID=UPI0036733B87
MGIANYAWIDGAVCRDSDHMEPLTMARAFAAKAEAEGRGLRVDEVIKVLEVGRKAIHTMRKRGDLRSTVIGQVVYVDPASLITYLRNQEIDPFFPRMSQRRDAERAIAICKTCPVIKECLDHALRNFEDEGVWGGMTAKERVALRIRQGRRRPPSLDPVLSPEEVIEIRAKYTRNFKAIGNGGVQALAVEYNVSESTISRVTKGIAKQLSEAV